jgi:hypothetical protein
MREYKYRDIWRARIVSFMLGILLMGLILTFWPRQINPPPDNPTVTENPSKNEQKQADVIITRQESGEIVSRVKIVPKKASGGAGGSSGAENGSVAPSPNEWDPGGNLQEQNLILPVGSQWTAPAEITLKVNYLSLNKDHLGQGEQKVTGETMVTAGADELIITTHFSNSVDIAVTIPDPPKKSTLVGFNLTADFTGVYLGGYYRRDFYLWEWSRGEVVGYVCGEVLGRLIGAGDPWINCRVETGIFYRY